MKQRFLFLLPFLLALGCAISQPPNDPYMEMSRGTEGPAITYPQKPSPTPTDELLGIDTPDSETWKISRFPLSALIELIAAATGNGVLYQTECQDITGGFCIDSDGSDGTLGTFSFATEGSGYLVGDELVVGAGEAALEVTAIDGAGGIVAASTTAVGSGYAPGTTYAIAGGTGSGATITVTANGNAGAAFFHNGTSVVSMPLSHLSGLTGNVQDQLNGKQDKNLSQYALENGDSSLRVETDRITWQVGTTPAAEMREDGFHIGPVALSLALTDGEAMGTVLAGIGAKEALTAGQVVYLDPVSSQWAPALDDGSGKMPPQGVVTQPSDANVEVRPLSNGTYRNDSVFDFTPHRSLCVSTTVAGQIEECTEANASKKIGWSTSNSLARFMFDPVAVAEYVAPPPPPGPEDPECTSYIDGLTGAPSMTSSSNRRRGAYLTGERFTGFIIDDAASGEFCDSQWLLSSVGDLTGYDFYEEIWEINPSTLTMTTMVGRSNKVDGAAWAEAGTAVTFTYAAPVAYDCTGTKKYARVLKRIADGDPSSYPPIISTTNYFFVGINPGANTLSGIEGMAHWQGPYASQPLTVYGLVAADDPSVKVFTMQGGD